MMNGSLYVGIDAGSSATKCVVVDIEGNLLSTGVTSSGFDYSAAAERVLTQALEQAGQSRADIAFCVSTGYGRGRVAFSDRKITEITCHARGAMQWYPEVEYIVDIGGQDTKVIRVDPHGKMADYRMNAKCAAGTGAFLESIALRLGMPLTDVDELAMQSTSATVVNSYCTVFAGTEVLERIKDGQPPQDISMGLFRSIASRVFEMFPFCGGPVAATGGVVTYCRAMVRALEEVLKRPVLRPPLPQHAGAYGGALLAREFAMSRRVSNHVV
ncbi:MAG: ATPase [Planctomycetia bacterium]|nr:ATPase [Planctomycetia bacterium]MCC7314009.1 ATPase [Planctomycetota bacterium]